MQAIIFDVDNTLIEWKDEFIFALKNVLNSLGYEYNEELLKKIDNAVATYEQHDNYLDKERMLDYVNSSCDTNLPLDFIDMLEEEQGNCYYEDLELLDTLKYLSSKYDLYVITNWFTKTQRKRLENMHVLEYFKSVVGADNSYFKPNRNVYNIVLQRYGARNCICVGDNLDCDILIPRELGMRVIWKTDEESDKYQTIKKISDLKNIL